MKSNIAMEDSLKSMYTGTHGTTDTMLGNIRNIVNLLKYNIDNKEEVERFVTELHEAITGVIDNHTKEYHIFCMLYHNTKI